MSANRGIGIIYNAGLQGGSGRGLGDIYHSGATVGMGRRKQKGEGIMDLINYGKKAFNTVKNGVDWAKQSGLIDLGKETAITGGKIADLIKKNRQAKAGTGRKRRSRGKGKK